MSREWLHVLGDLGWELTVSSDLDHTRAILSPHFRLNPCHVFQKHGLRNPVWGQIHRYAAAKTNKVVDSLFAALATPKEIPAFSTNSLLFLCLALFFLRHKLRVSQMALGKITAYSQTSSWETHSCSLPSSLRVLGLPWPCLQEIMMLLPHSTSPHSFQQSCWQPALLAFTFFF